MKRWAIAVSLVLTLCWASLAWGAVVKIGSVPYIITKSGSYCLAKNLTYTSITGYAIDVQVDNVTIDFMGFTITGPGPSTAQGIYMHGRKNVEIRNGTLMKFSTAIYDGSFTPGSHRIINMRLLENNVHGMVIQSYGALIKDCTSAHNLGSGIAAGNGSTIVGNTSHNNGMGGILAFYGSTVIGNTAYKNDTGLSISYGSTIKNNTAYDNTNYGIWMGNYCLLDGNTTYSNGTANMYTGSTGCIWAFNVHP